MPLVRIWHGGVPLERADEYERFLIERAAPDYASVEGLLRLYFTRRDEGDVAHFLPVKVWDSMESMRRFAGEGAQGARPGGAVRRGLALSARAAGAAGRVRTRGRLPPRAPGPPSS